MAAWNDARVYDVSTPATPRFVGAVRLTREIGSAEDGRPPVTSRTLGVAARGDVMFVGNWHVIHSYRIRPDRPAPSLVLPEDINLVDFGPVAPGASTTVPLTVRQPGHGAADAVNRRVDDNPRFAVTPAQVRIARESRDALGHLHRIEDGQGNRPPADPVGRSGQADRAGYLVGNQPGLGVGKPLPETTVTLVDGGQWSSSEAKGQVTLLAYFATF